jgi:hypothetical protein
LVRQIRQLGHALKKPREPRRKSFSTSLFTSRLPPQARNQGCEDWEAAAIGGATWPQIGSVGTRASKASDTDPAGSVLSDGKVVEAAQGNFPFSRRDALIQAIKGPIVKTAGEQIARQEAMQPGVIAREAQVRHSRYTFPR